MGAFCYLAFISHVCNQGQCKESSAAHGNKKRGINKIIVSRWEPVAQDEKSLNHGWLSISLGR